MNPPPMVGYPPGYAPGGGPPPQQQQQQQQQQQPARPMVMLGGRVLPPGPQQQFNMPPPHPPPGGHKDGILASLASREYDMDGLIAVPQNGIQDPRVNPMPRPMGPPPQMPMQPPHMHQQQQQVPRPQGPGPVPVPVNAPPPGMMPPQQQQQQQPPRNFPQQPQPQLIQQQPRPQTMPLSAPNLQQQQQQQQQPKPALVLQGFTGAPAKSAAPAPPALVKQPQIHPGPGMLQQRTGGGIVSPSSVQGGLTTGCEPVCYGRGLNHNLTVRTQAILDVAKYQELEKRDTFQTKIDGRALYEAVIRQIKFNHYGMPPSSQLAFAERAVPYKIAVRNVSWHNIPVAFGVEVEDRLLGAFNCYLDNVTNWNFLFVSRHHHVNGSVKPELEFEIKRILGSKHLCAAKMDPIQEKNYTTRQMPSAFDDEERYVVERDSSIGQWILGNKAEEMAGEISNDRRVFEKRGPPVDVRKSSDKQVTLLHNVPKKWIREAEAALIQQAENSSIYDRLSKGITVNFVPLPNVVRSKDAIPENITFNPAAKAGFTAPDSDTAFDPKEPAWIVLELDIKIAIPDIANCAASVQCGGHGCCC